eukprot:31029-Pelagococcus_subviridis.AAC.8
MSFPSPRLLRAAPSAPSSGGGGGGGGGSSSESSSDVVASASASSSSSSARTPLPAPPPPRLSSGPKIFNSAPAAHTCAGTSPTTSSSPSAGIAPASRIIRLDAASRLMF